MIFSHTPSMGKVSGFAKKSTIFQWHMGWFIYCLILHEDQNISSWELDMNIWFLLGIDVSNYWSVGVPAVYCSTACSVTVSWTREAGGGAGCPPVQCTAAVICHHNTTAGPAHCSPATPATPSSHNHTTVSVRSLAHLNAEWVAFCI